MESRWERAANDKLPGACAELLLRGGLSPEAEELLRDIADSGRSRGKRFPREAFAHYLWVRRSDGSVQCWGSGLQSRTPKLRQHHSLPQRERTIFAAQQGVIQWQQLAVLYSGYSMRCLTFAEVPPPSAKGSPQRSTAIQEELATLAEEEGLSLDDAGVYRAGCCPWYEIALDGWGWGRAAGSSAHRRMFEAIPCH